jgi:hypothetical protein
VQSEIPVLATVATNRNAGFSGSSFDALNDLGLIPNPPGQPDTNLSANMLAHDSGPYVQLLNSMVSCISTTVLSGDADTGVSFLEHSRKYLNQILPVPNYDTYNNEDDVIPTTEMQSYAQTFGVV